MSSELNTSTDARLGQNTKYQRAAPYDAGSGYVVLVVPTAQITRTGGRTGRGSVRVVNGPAALVRLEAVESASPGSGGSLSASKAPRVTAVVQVSANEDDVLEIYAEDLDRQTVEWINRL